MRFCFGSIAQNENFKKAKFLDFQLIPEILMKPKYVRLYWNYKLRMDCTTDESIIM